MCPRGQMMDKPVCLAYIEDETIHAELENLARESGFECFFAVHGEQLAQLIKSWAPFMLIVDLCGIQNEWIYRHLTVIDFLYPEFPMVAVIPEDEEHVRHRVESYGCRFALTKSECTEKLPELLLDILGKKF